MKAYGIRADLGRQPGLFHLTRLVYNLDVVAIWVEHPGCEIVGVILKLWPRRRLDACPCRNRGIKEFSHFGLALGGESDVNCVWSGFSFLEPEEKYRPLAPNPFRCGWPFSPGKSKNSVMPSGLNARS